MGPGLYLEECPLPVPEELKGLLKDVGEVVEVEPAHLREEVDGGDHAHGAGGRARPAHWNCDIRTENETFNLK